MWILREKNGQILMARKMKLVIGGARWRDADDLQVATRPLKTSPVQGQDN